MLASVSYKLMTLLTFFFQYFVIRNGNESVGVSTKKRKYEKIIYKIKYKFVNYFVYYFFKFCCRYYAPCTVTVTEFRQLFYCQFEKTCVA
jgi:hypothetical protein